MKGDWPKILKKVEDAVVAKGGAKRMGTWAYSYGYTNSVALGELSKILIERKETPKEFKLKMKDVVAAYEKFTPGAKWNGSLYTDIATGVKKKNHLLMYEDTYVFGLGYLGMTKLTVPEKYFKVK